jgi:CRP/FNR family cyclic AMP-dependent transcriptional regulator
MASLKASLQHLRNVPLFSSCSNKELERIAKAADEVNVKAGTLIVDQGQTGREAYILLKGVAVVRRNGKKVTSLSEGSVIGELSLLDHGPRTASVSAETDCTLLVISQRNLYGVIDKVPSVAHKLLSALATRIRDLDRAYYGVNCPSSQWSGLAFSLP